MHASPSFIQGSENHFQLPAERRVGVECTPLRILKGIRWPRTVEIYFPTDSQ